MQVYVVNSVRTGGVGCFGVFTSFEIAVRSIEKAYGYRVLLVDITGGGDIPKSATVHIGSAHDIETVGERLYVAPHTVNAMA